MKKIPSVFQRNYETDRLCRDEATPGCEWVLAGEGVATVKYDGTACMIRDGKLFKRYDRKVPKKQWQKRRRSGATGPVPLEMFKPAPDGWEACQEPDQNTGHWPGWLPVGDGPEDKWHRAIDADRLNDGTYELVGKAIGGNPYGFDDHRLWRHGKNVVEVERTYEAIRAMLESEWDEGLVFYHPDGRMAKVKRKDFGIDWPGEVGP